MQIVIERDYQQFSNAAAGIVAAELTNHPALRLCLPTGNTPIGMYGELIRRHQSEGLDFSQAVFFNLDEYLGLPRWHPQSFRTYLWRRFFDHVNVTATNIHAPDERYEETIRDAGGIDLAILGIGSNGHVAFNEPGSPLDSRTRIVELAPSTIEGMRANFPPEELPRSAITVGLATILDARRILVLVSGERKSDILRRTLTEPVSPTLPASVLQQHPNVTVIADAAAAPKLPS